jgi:hypothetical protein
MPSTKVRALRAALKLKYVKSEKNPFNKLFRLAKYFEKQGFSWGLAILKATDVGLVSFDAAQWRRHSGETISIKTCKEWPPGEKR